MTPQDLPNAQAISIARILERREAFRLATVLSGYRLTARSEGLSEATITLVETATRHLARFLERAGLSADVADVGVEELRQFIVYLQEYSKYSDHAITPTQDQKLSGFAVNGYLRSVRMLWAWMCRDGLITDNPFDRLRIPKPPEKEIVPFSREQLAAYFSAIDTRGPLGRRDYAIGLLLVDSGIRSQELRTLSLANTDLTGRTLHVTGKGNRQRAVPVGARVQSSLWRYINYHRPEPATRLYENVFLTDDGYPLTKGRLLAIIKGHGRAAGIIGVRISPHTFRHTFAIEFLRNGGNVLALQRILGHRSIEMTQRYTKLLYADLTQAHETASPVDNLDLGPGSGGRRRNPSK